MKTTSMKRVGYCCAVLVFVSGPVVKAQGVMPIPDITGASVESTVVDAGNAGLEYRYTIVNPSSATGRIWLMNVDVSSAERGGPTTLDLGNPFLRTYPVRGGASTEPMVTLVNLLAPYTGLKGTEVLVIGQRAPNGWNGGVTRQGYAQFAAQNTTFAITPDNTTDGFSILFDRPPTIRQASLTPHWVFEVADHTEVTQAEMDSAVVVQQSIPVQVSVLGPLDIDEGGNAHYNRLLDDISLASDIGWVTDDALRDAVSTNVRNARDEFRIGNNGLAQAQLQAAIDAVQSADPGGFNPEFRDLAVVNLQTLIDLLPSSRNTFIPVFTATPLAAELERGDTFTLTMRHFNSALDGNPPLEGLRILVRCLPERALTGPFDPNIVYFDCANSDALVPGETFRFSATGEVVFTYEGSNTGLDVIEIVENDFEVFRRLAIVEVNWTADADLVVPLFVPPLVLASEGDTILITEATANVGTRDVDTPSVTAYFISDDDNLSAANIGSATFLGQRVVPPLPAGEWSFVLEQPFDIPPGFTADVHFLAACADYEASVVESVEENNCSFSEVERMFDVGMLTSDPGSNSPPVAISQNVETEKNVPVAVTLTATDADGDVLSFSVSSGPANGALSGAPPDLTYTPALDYVGDDSFAFIANDGSSDSNAATISISVTGTTCIIQLDELVERDGSATLTYSGSDQGKAGTGLRLTSMGRIYDQHGSALRTVWRIRNTATVAQTVLLDAYNDPYSITLDVDARTELFFASPVATGAATHRLFLGPVQVDVKAAGNQSFNNDTEVDDPQCVP